MSFCSMPREGNTQATAAPRAAMRKFTARNQWTTAAGAVQTAANDVGSTSRHPFAMMLRSSKRNATPDATAKQIHARAGCPAVAARTHARKDSNWPQRQHSANDSATITPALICCVFLMWIFAAFKSNAAALTAATSASETTVPPSPEKPRHVMTAFDATKSRLVQTAIGPGWRLRGLKRNVPAAIPSPTAQALTVAAGPLEKTVTTARPSNMHRGMTILHKYTLMAKAKAGLRVVGTFVSKAAKASATGMTLSTSFLSLGGLKRSKEASRPAAGTQASPQRRSRLTTLKAGAVLKNTCCPLPVSTIVLRP
mmetsp:Transcript_93767/g.264803  ORF Transcript_93767/g.264803 Transcript_93767/m.264803 type:complete len:311 (+) Transcript_93767:819-1751(+)